VKVTIELADGSRVYVVAENETVRIMVRCSPRKAVRR